jgi:hypothetical protein
LLLATNNPFYTDAGGTFTIADGNGNSVEFEIDEGDYDGGLFALFRFYSLKIFWCSERLSASVAR